VKVGMGCVRRRARECIKAAILIAALLSAAPSAAQPFAGGGAQMPDAQRMSGVPLPMGDMPVGTVTVRVARGAVTNPLPGIAVELTGAGAPRTASTDEQGRATFIGLTPGTRVKASTTVTGEKLESQEFDVPPTGGVRVALVATDPELVKKAEQDRQLAGSAPVEGTVVLGEQSRLVIELGDDGLNVFNILQILASVHRVTVDGPFAPGSTLLQFGYTLPFGSADMIIRQTMPVQLTGLAVAVQTNGAMHLSSPQLAQQRQMAADGQSFIVAQGPGVPAGSEIALNLSGLPHAPVWPRNVTLLLASAVLIGGAWAAVRRPHRTDTPSGRGQLEQRRERLFSSLAALDQRHRRGELDGERYEEQRQDLVAALGRVYFELDQKPDGRAGESAV
jgi:hypothetical protein